MSRDSRLEVFGYSAKQTKKFTATFDTGYTGFLAMPFTSAAPLALILVGTESYTLADGSGKVDLSCLGTVKFDGKEIVGSIDVSFAGGSILLGMEFLRKAELVLFVDPKNGETKIEPATVSSPTFLSAPIVETELKEPPADSLPKSEA